MVMLTPGRMSPLTSLVIPEIGVDTTVSAQAIGVGNVDISKLTRMVAISRGCSTTENQFLVILLAFLK
jgi:hypothetical protein